MPRAATVWHSVSGVGCSTVVLYLQFSVGRNFVTLMNYTSFIVIYYTPPKAGALSDGFVWRTSVCCLFIAYIGP